MANDSTTPDLVNHPPHYTAGAVECIDAIKAALGDDGYKGYCQGQIMKYVWRFQHKNGVEDLRKAGFYLNELIKQFGE
jgi:hypothetical protein